MNHDSVERSPNTLVNGIECNRGLIRRATKPVQRWPRPAEGEQLRRERNLRIEEFLTRARCVWVHLCRTLLQGFFSPSLVLAGTFEGSPDSILLPPLSCVLRLMHRVIEEGCVVFQGTGSMTTSNSVEQAFCELVEELAPAGGATFRVLVMGQPKELERAIQDQVYMIGREALLNALRHSNAKSIEVEIDYLPRRLRVIVRDSGTGIDPHVLRSDSHGGLLRMHEWAAIIGAQLGIWTRKAAGTEVEIGLPLEAMSKRG